MAEYHHRPNNTATDIMVVPTPSSNNNISTVTDIGYNNNTGTTTNNNPTIESTPTICRRYIYDDTDLQHFLQSPSKDALYKFTTAMGKSCATSTSTITTGTGSKTYQYNPKEPLIGISPGIACLHGILYGIKEWIIIEFPPTSNNSIGNRFGNPIFRNWYKKLMNHTNIMITTLLKVSYQYSQKTTLDNNNDDENDDFDIEILMKAYEAGIQSTRDTDTTTSSSNNNISENDELISDHDRMIISELALYLQDSFGHPIRLDYGTGHETSFHIFLFLLCQLHVFDNTGYQFHISNDSNINDNNNDAEENKDKQQQQNTILPSIIRCKAIIISSYHQYLLVTREIQTQYWLEPAGSHGVWGLDDYHCLPFYFGACQLIEQQQNNNTQSLSSSSSSCFTPSSIHDEQILQDYGDTYLYFGCIRYIKLLKKNVPFYESSPMLDDISHIGTWFKIATGLIKLYDGEVLSKRQVVQHLVFGTLFPANWVPSHSEDTMLPPSETFRTTTSTTSSATTHTTSHPRPTTSTMGNNNMDPTVMTKAPWAK